MTLQLDSFTGAIILPEHDDYESAKNAYGGEGAPAAILRPSTAADVAEAVKYAKASDLVVSVRSGGHSGFATNTDGLVIDLLQMNSVEVLDAARVRIGSGASWGAVAKALQPHGLAISSGDTTSVGVGGLTLGGGVGWLVRQRGLSIDSLLEAEVVTADGSILTASADSEPELFWGLRGGGGNFGVVTSFTFQAHPLRGVVGGAIQFGLDDMAGVLRGWRDVMRAAPEELNSTFLATPAMGPEMPPALQVLVCYAGDDEEAASAAIDPLLRIPGVQGHTLNPTSYSDLLQDAHPPGGPILLVDNNSFASDLSDELVEKLAAVYREFGTSVLMIRYLSGAFNRVPADATAFAYRESEVLLIFMAVLPADAPVETIQRIRDLWAGLAPATEGSYGNFIQQEGEASIAAMYPPETRARLAALKHRYDPDNLFRRNHNVAPVAP